MKVETEKKENRKFTIDKVNKQIHVRYKLDVIVKINFLDKHLEFTVSEDVQIPFDLEDYDADIEKKIENLEKIANDEVNKKVQSIINKFQTLEKFGYLLMVNKE